jgi:uncharacterized protein CbrC (UPF0167 family)
MARAPKGDAALPAFKYFADPVGVGVFEKSDQPCACCGKARGWVYTGPVYSEADEAIVCPWCIADGSAAAKFSCTFNDTGQLYSHPDNEDEPDPDELAEIEERTPGFENWQGNYWYVCCGHAAVFLGDASGEDLQGRWKSALPVVFADAEEILEDLQENLDELERGGSPGVYVFKCPHCGKLGGYFDMD